MKLPETETLALSLHEGVLHLTLDRPERKNAMNTRMIEELGMVFDALGAATEVRAVVLRGAGGSFCAGADLKDMAGSRQDAANDAPGAAADVRATTARGNRRFGTIAARASALPQPLVAVIEGAVMGGGFGLACVSDVAIAHRDARFGLPETGLGLVPAQIAPFVIERIGLTQARRLMLTGARVDGSEALRLGLVHELYDSTEALDIALERVLASIRRCAPGANAATKRLIRRVSERELDAILDYAAELFADAALGDEGREGARAFVEKRLPGWAAGRNQSP